MNLKYFVRGRTGWVLAWTPPPRTDPVELDSNQRPRSTDDQALRVPGRAAIGRRGVTAVSEYIEPGSWCKRREMKTEKEVSGGKRKLWRIRMRRIDGRTGYGWLDRSPWPWSRRARRRLNQAGMTGRRERGPGGKPDINIMRMEKRRAETWHRWKNVRGSVRSSRSIEFRRLPINRSPQTPRRSRSPAKEKHRVSVVDEMTTQELDDQTETRDPTSPRKSQQPRKDSTKSGSKREVRPDNLLLSTPSHLARRRSSTTCAPESLKPSSAAICPNSPSGLRRNSYTGAVSPMKASPSPMPVYSTGRRNSAITYLTGSPVRTVSRGHQSPCSPSRRQNNSEELSHVNEDRRTPSSGCAGLTSEQLRAHLENLARLAANRSRSSSGGETGAMRSDGLPEEDDDDLEQDAAPVYRVMVLGSHGVGKTTLLKQLLTSEYLANKDSNDQGEKNISFTRHDIRLVCTHHSFHFITNISPRKLIYTAECANVTVIYQIKMF